MAVFQSSEHHDEPALDISRLKYNALLFDDHFQVAFEELVHHIKVLSAGKDVERSAILSSKGTRKPIQLKAEPR